MTEDEIRDFLRRRPSVAAVLPLAMQGKTHKEIAVALNIGAEAAHSRLGIAVASGVLPRWSVRRGFRK